MSIYEKFYREVPPLSSSDSFLVFDRIKDSFDFPVHYHQEFEINFILNGLGVKRIIGDHIAEIDAIELVLVGQNLHHGWDKHICANRQIHEITIQFQDDLFHESLLSRRIMNPIREMLNRSGHGILFSRKTAEELTPRFLRLSKLDGMDYFLEITSLLHDLANSRGQRLLSSYAVNQESFESHDKMKHVHEYVQENFAAKITLEDVAGMLCMSTASFNRFMKRRTGKTWINYVNEIRIGYAVRYLMEREVSISEAAYMCGFTNLAHFNRSFKALKNCTPSQYKKEFYGLKRIL